MADRYTYIPFIGLFIAVVWMFKVNFGEESAQYDHGLLLKRVSSSHFLRHFLIRLCLLLTHRQLSCTGMTTSCCSGHAVEATPGNYFAEFELATSLEKVDRTDDAIKHYAACLQLNPLYEPGRFRLGLALLKQGKLDEAAFQLSDALKRDPKSEVLHNSLGVARARQGRSADAVAEFNAAIHIKPDYLQPYVNCGVSALQKPYAAGGSIDQLLSSAEYLRARRAGSAG